MVHQGVAVKLIVGIALNHIKIDISESEAIPEDAPLAMPSCDLPVPIFADHILKSVDLLPAVASVNKKVGSASFYQLFFLLTGLFSFK